MAAEVRTWAVEELVGQDGLSADEIPRAKIWLASGKLDRQYLLTGTKADVVSVIKCGLESAGTSATVNTPDTSRAKCRELVGPDLQGMPAVEDLTKMLHSPPLAKLPVSKTALRLIPDELSQFFEVADTELSQVFSAAICANNKPQAEPWTAYLLNIALVDPIQKIDDLLPTGTSVGLLLFRDQGDSESTMTILSRTGRPLRSDLQFRIAQGDRLLAKVEEKGKDSDLSAAVSDLHEKTAAWSPLLYGDLQYLPCVAAAGNMLQFHVITRSDLNLRCPVGELLNLSKPADRAMLLICGINFYRLLKAAKTCIPEYVLPVNKKLPKRTGDYTRTILFRSDELVALKTISPWAEYERHWHVNFDDIKEAYRATASACGVVHGAPQLKEGRNGEESYVVELCPIGLSALNAKPRNELEAQAAAHGLLHGLDALHEAGIVHRDLRWENVACSVDRRCFFLLDLELCGKAGPWPPRLTSWDIACTLVPGGQAPAYVQASDLFCLGALLRECTGVIKSAEGRAFLDKVSLPASQQDSTAAQLLAHRWIGCSSLRDCPGAGAPPAWH